MASKDGREFINTSVPAELKAAAAALAERRGLRLAGLVKTLVENEVDADAAERAARRTDEQAPRLGAVRNVTTRMLTGACLHPIHRREQWGVTERCSACGTPTGAVSARG